MFPSNLDCEQKSLVKEPPVVFTDPAPLSNIQNSDENETTQYNVNGRYLQMYGISLMAAISTNCQNETALTTISHVLVYMIDTKGQMRYSCLLQNNLKHWSMCTLDNKMDEYLIHVFMSECYAQPTM